jgi:hypothetical protein
MEHIIIEYLKVFWGWPLATIILVLLLKKPLVLLISALARGGEVKLGKYSVKIPSVEIKEEKDGGGIKKAIVSVNSEIPPELTSFQLEILKKFILKGNYDSLNVSKNLIEDFRKLKLVGAFDWSSEETDEKQVTLSDFIVTQKGKEMGA